MVYYKAMRHFALYTIIGIFAVISGLVAARLAGFQFAATLFPEVHTPTPQELKEKYHTSGLSVLIVPGHDLQYSGTSFKGISEAALTVKVGEQLYNLLKQNPKLQIFSSRDFETGEYRPEFLTYFSDRRTDIERFRDTFKSALKRLVSTGMFQWKESPTPDTIPTISVRLNGINKWANEQNIDVVIHLHFNDYTSRRRRAPGKYQGFAVYVPDHQYPHYEVSRALAAKIFGQLEKTLSVSTAPHEDTGIVEDQEIIAIGPYATRNGISLLIEYGYIYEPQFTDPSIRPIMLRELAYQTSRGIEQYFDGREESEGRPQTLLFPYQWKYPLQKGTARRRDVFFMQTALRMEGVYPPSGADPDNCPINGLYGPCTQQAVRLFQEKYRREILGSGKFAKGSGIAGSATLKKLNALYGVSYGTQAHAPILTAN